MSNWHSTLSRRTFMKALLVGGGLGTAAAVMPPINDLDELITAGSFTSDPRANNPNPWYVGKRIQGSNHGD